jgi:hypothetical protein
MGKLSKKTFRADYDQPFSGGGSVEDLLSGARNNLYAT